MNYKILESNILFRGKVFDLRVDKIKYDSGNEGIREIAVHPGGAVIVPVQEDGKLIMISQFRYPFEKFLIEFPAGKLDINEDPEVCALRELQEETGYSAGTIEKLGDNINNPGFLYGNSAYFPCKEFNSREIITGKKANREWK